MKKEEKNSYNLHYNLHFQSQIDDGGKGVGVGEEPTKNYVKTFLSRLRKSQGSSPDIVKESLGILIVS